MWMLWVVCCGGCWIGVVFVPFGQRHLSLFLASFHLYTNSRSFSYLNKVVFLQVILGAVLLQTQICTYKMVHLLKRWFLYRMAS